MVRIARQTAADHEYTVPGLNLSSRGGAQRNPIGMKLRNLPAKRVGIPLEYCEDR